MDEKEIWIQEEMAAAIDAGAFSDESDPELRAYAERAYRRDHNPDSEKYQAAGWEAGFAWNH